jgi:hypothetical protein
LSEEKMEKWRYIGDKMMGKNVSMKFGRGDPMRLFWKEAAEYAQEVLANVEDAERVIPIDGEHSILGPW